jgi:DNA-binding SARP family transcriptional activator
MRPVPGAGLAGLPLPLPDEVSRPRLLGRLDARWHHPVTVIQAGAGFGKSTLLAQAVRANAVEPQGIDVWHSCTPGDVDGDVLGQAVLTALRGPGRLHDPAAQIADTVAGYSPIEVCIVLDDAHEVRPGSSGAELIDRLIRRAPDNAHLVLAARHGPPVRLSRLRAADRLVEIMQEDLLFTRDETSAMAKRLGREPDAATTLGGWPALVRLALTVRPEVAIDFAQEEVLNTLTDAQRRALFALSNLGYADRDRVGHVIGASIDLVHLAVTVPLVSRTEDGLFRAHDLWTEALVRVLPREELVELRTRVLDELVAGGDLARAGALAVAHDDLDALARIALEIVRRTVAALPIDMVRPWSDALQRRRPAAPETRLLNAALRQALDFTDRSADVEVDEAATGFRQRGDRDGEIVSLVVGTVGSYMRGDVPRLVDLARRAHAIPGSRDHPTIDVALRAIAAIGAEMTGDLEGALGELRAAPLDRIPLAIKGSVIRLLIHCLLLSGRADEAVDVAQLQLATSTDRATRYICAIARWMVGEPGELLALGRTSIDVPAITSRDEFVRRTLVASMLASTGRRDEVHRLVEGVHTSPRPLDARDAVLDAVARALCAIVDHDEAPAAQLITGAAAAHSDSPILDQHLRRFLALAYVLDASIRRRWDEAPMGPTHNQVRTMSRWLVDLRAGRQPDPAGLDPPKVFTAFPLPWSVELATRLHANRHSDGARLAEWLVNQVPEPARAELRHLGRSQGPVGPAASDLLARLPAVPARPLEVSVLGPLRVAFDGAAVSTSELRRARVRTLLALLVVHGTLRRELAIDLLWPEHDAANGARNLRVTLTYLRQLLEPERPTGEASFHVRADATTISLQSSDYLVVDLWELRRLKRDAERSRERADLERTISLLDAATSWWRGEPLTDLASVARQEHEIERVRLLQLDSLLELSELRLVRGQAANALVDAERALALDPYSERAHRLAIAAALRTHDRQRTDIVTERALAVLDELGVEPEPATQILLRHVATTDELFPHRPDRKRRLSKPPARPAPVRRS